VKFRHGSNAQNEFAMPDGFGDVFSRPGFIAGGHVRLVGLSAHHDDGNVAKPRIALQQSRAFAPVHLRHFDVH